MRDDLVGLLEKADLSIASCAGVVASESLDPLIESIRAVRTRLAYPDDLAVVALAGGTGSGKSSLFNALAGSDLADVGGVRPTTSEPAAAVPADRMENVDTYLDFIGVEERHSHQVGNWCLLDLPDTDSVVSEHRHRVDAILPLVDVVVWVADPEKYRDARLHDEYLRPLAAYSEQFVFVLNQIDRVDEAQQKDLVADFAAALAADGIDSNVIPIASSPPVGPPIGLEAVKSALDEKLAERDFLYAKLLIDVEGAAATLAGTVGSPVDFDERARPVIDDAVRLLTDGDSDEAIFRLTGFMDTIAEEVGDETAARVAALSADIPQHLLRIAAETEPAPRTGFFRRRAPSARRDPSVVRSSLTEAVVRPVRVVLAKRAMAVASVADLMVDIERLSRPAPR